MGTRRPRRGQRVAKVKGAAIGTTTAFLRGTLGNEVVEAILLELEDDAAAAFRNPRPFESYPASYYDRFYLLVEQELGSRVQFDALLRDMGRHVAVEHYDSVMKVLMQRLSSAEELWEQLDSLWYAYFERIEVDRRIEDGGLHVCRIENVNSPRHLGLISTGWLEALLRKTGASGVRVEPRVLSAGEAIDTIELELSWDGSLGGIR